MNQPPTILVTGATGSIGRSAALELARRGAHVVLVARRPTKLRAEVEDIHRALAALAPADTPGAEPPAPAVETLVVDFADQNSVRVAAAEALERFSRIDGLILSVGAFLQDGPTVLPDGHEVMFAANVLGPFLFTELLAERLEASRGLVAHVIAPFKVDLDWDDLESIRRHKPMVAFDRTKVCNRVVAAELARRRPALCSVAYHPSFVIDRSDPDLKSRWPTGLWGLFWSLSSLFARKPSVAGVPLAELMLSGDRAGLSGSMVKLGKRVGKPDAAMADEAMGTRLWQELVARTDGSRA